MAFPLLTPPLAASLSSATSIYNLLPYSEDVSQWQNEGTMVSGPLNLNANGQFTGYAVSGTGSEWHRTSAVAIPVIEDEVLSARLYLRPGTSNSVRIMARYQDTITSSHNLTGALDSLPTTGGNITLMSNTLLADGISREITLSLVSPRDTTLFLNIGANSAISGETVIILAAQLERGATASPYQKTPA